MIVTSKPGCIPSSLPVFPGLTLDSPQPRERERDWERALYLHSTDDLLLAAFFLIYKHLRLCTSHMKPVLFTNLDLHWFERKLIIFFRSDSI